jgi:hypothetical protein
MRASSLIYEILKGCGVSDNAAKAMETVSEQLLGRDDLEVYVEVNGQLDADIEKFETDLHGSLCLTINIEKEDID